MTQKWGTIPSWSPSRLLAVLYVDWPSICSSVSLCSRVSRIASGLLRHSPATDELLLVLFTLPSSSFLPFFFFFLIVSGFDFSAQDILLCPMSSIMWVMSIQNYSTAGLLPPPPPTLPPPPYPVQYVRVSGGVPAGSGRTTLHAVLDYDDDEDEGRPPGSGGPHQPAEEFRGPILVKNGSVPVVPLYSYSSTYNNGTLVHIPVSNQYSSMP